MHWYNDGVHGDPDDHEGDKVQKVTRGSIYSKVFKILHRTYRIVQAACERAEKYAVVHGHMRDHNDLILTPTPPRQHHHTHPPTRPTHTTVIVAIINNVNI